MWRLSASLDNTLPDLQNSLYATQPHSIIANYFPLTSTQMRFQKPPFWHCFWLCVSNRKRTKIHLFFKALINNYWAFSRRSFSSASVCDRLSIGARPDRGKNVSGFKTKIRQCWRRQRGIIVNIEILKQLSVIGKTVFQLTNPVRSHLLAPKRNRDSQCTWNYT